MCSVGRCNRFSIYSQAIAPISCTLAAETEICCRWWFTWVCVLSYPFHAPQLSLHRFFRHSYSRIPSSFGSAAQSMAQVRRHCIHTAYVRAVLRTLGSVAHCMHAWKLVKQRAAVLAGPMKHAGITKLHDSDSGR